MFVDYEYDVYSKTGEGENKIIFLSEFRDEIKGEWNDEAV